VPTPEQSHREAEPGWLIYNPLRRLPEGNSKLSADYVGLKLYGPALPARKEIMDGTWKFPEA
jgi:hypothetical protein